MSLETHATMASHTSSSDSCQNPSMLNCSDTRLSYFGFWLSASSAEISAHHPPRRPTLMIIILGDQVSLYLKPVRVCKSSKDVSSQ